MYICPKCQTAFAVEEATAVNYYCTPCKRYLCAQTERPSIILAVPAIAPEPEQAKVIVALPPPASLADLFDEAIGHQTLDSRSLAEINTRKIEWE